MPPRSGAQNAALLTRIGVTQRHVVTRRQLLRAGFDSDAVSRRIAAGRWQLVGHVVVLHSGQLDDGTLQWASVLSVAGLTALAGRTAAREWGLRGFDAQAVEVLVVRGASPPTIAGVHWRASRRFGPADVERGRRPARVGAARSVVDAAAWTASPKIACALLAAAVQQRIVVPSALRRELATAGAIRHRRVLTAVLGDIVGGADCLAEIRFTSLARRAGLPPPCRQSFRSGSDGRKRYLDVDYGAFVVEVDGSLHLSPLNYWADARRQNDLVIGGDRVLRFPSVALRLEPEIVVAQLRAAGIAFGLVRA